MQKKMKVTVLLPSIFLALLLMAGVSFGASFDFAEVADGNLNVDSSTQGPTTGEFGTTSFEWTVDGIRVKGSARMFDDPTHPPAYHAYFDAGDAGLGVCQILDGNDCDPSSDDNITVTEILQLEFDEKVILTSIEFKDADHENTNFGMEQFFYSTDMGLNWTAGTLAATFNTPITVAAGEKIWFTPESNFGKDETRTNQFYLNVVNAVPIPSTLLIFGVGFIGFSVWRNRWEKRNSA